MSDNEPGRVHRGFTLLELAIVMAILSITTLPFIAAFKLPMTVRASQDAIRSASGSYRQFFNHLSEDVRLADGIRIEGESGLRLEVGEAVIVYEKTEYGVRRSTTDTRDSNRKFENMESRFSLVRSEIGMGVRAETTLQIPVHRSDLIQHRNAVFRSHLGGDHEKE